MNTNHKSTYALLVGSEEKERGALEIIVFTLSILSVVAAIWQFALQPVTIPAAGIEAPPCVACNLDTAQAGS